jgi:hypothetical protein
MTLWQVLTNHRTILSPPAWMAAVFFLGMGLYAGWLAVSPAPPMWNDDLDLRSIAEEQKEFLATFDVVMRAVESDDQELRQAALRQWEALKKTQDDRKAKRKADREARVRMQRAKLGSFCVASIATGIWCCLRARGYGIVGRGIAGLPPHAIGS